MAEVYSLYLMEILMQSNGSISIDDAWCYFLMQFPGTWDNFSEFESFVLSQSVLFGMQNSFIFLKDSYAFNANMCVPADFNPIYSVPQVPICPPVHAHNDDFAAEAEAVKYFQKQINRRGETWVPIKSLAGHLSQASSNIRAVVGPQSDFVYFLLRHPRIFEVQGDLVSLRDEIRPNYFLRQAPQSRSSGRRNRPMSMYVPSVSYPSVQLRFSHLTGTTDIRNCTNLVPSQFTLNLAQPIQVMDQCKNQTIVISLVDYVAAMWLREAIERLGGAEDSAVPIDNLIQEFVTAPINVRNSVGLTRIELTEFLEKFNQLFELDQMKCKNRMLDKISTTFVISDSSNANSRSISLVNKKGVAYCVYKSWGIIDLGQHEHVFFDRSLFKHVENLTKHFSVGEMLCFNAILAPKESRAKWRATRVWKESDTLAAQFSSLDLTTDVSAVSFSPRNGSTSSSSSEGNSDSGVHDTAESKPCMDSLLKNSEFNIIRLDVDDINTVEYKLLDLQEPEGLDDDDSDDENFIPRNRVTKTSHSAGDQSDDNTSSDLSTMSDIPSISSCLPTTGMASTGTKSAGNFVSSGTQTYFTGDILAKRVYHAGAEAQPAAS